MPSLINRVPPGLLSLLGIKALGQNPQWLPDSLQPTLELLQLYTSANAQESTYLTPAIGAAGAFVSTTAGPGPGELWLVDRMSVYTNGGLPVGTTLTDVRPIYQNTATNALTFLNGTAASATVGEQLIIGGQQFVLPVGCRLGAHVRSLALGTAQQLTVCVRYVPLVI